MLSGGSYVYFYNETFPNKLLNGQIVSYVLFTSRVSQLSTRTKQCLKYSLPPLTTNVMCS